LPKDAERETTPGFKLSRFSLQVCEIYPSLVRLPNVFSPVALQAVQGTADEGKFLFSVQRLRPCGAASPQMPG
jgi:hypothetical protein